MLHKLKRLMVFMKGSRLLYGGAILSIGLSALIGLLSPLVVRYTLDTLIAGEEAALPGILQTAVDRAGGIPALQRNLWMMGLLLLCINVVNGLFMFLRGKWSAQAAESTAKNMRDTLYNHLQHLPYDYHVKAETGDLIQRCTSDVETIRRFLAMQFVEVGRALFMLTVALIIMLSLDVRMTLMSTFVIPFIVSFSFIFFKKVQKAFQLSDESEGRLSTTLQENLTGVRVVRAFGRQAFETEKFEKRNREYTDLTYKLIRLLAGYWSLSDVFSMMQIGVVVIFGAYWASIGQITLGTLTVFLAYVGMLLWPIRQMGRILTDMGKTMVSVGRIQEILNTPLETQDPDSVKVRVDGDIEFKDVTFEYEPEKPVLRGLSFKVKRGQTVAILGPTGSGKSSLVHLLQRLYEPQSGAITIGGIDLQKIDKKCLRSQVGIVLQEPFLYSKTIRENIGIAKKDVQDQEIFDAGYIASIHDVIESFDKGYDTAVGERGVTLSGGQKQRVAIARTLIQDSAILIFDDSLSAVDTETDAAIRRELQKRSKHITTFIISHRITTLSEADIILVLEEGRLVQSGTHEQLVNQPGLYKRVWAIQNALEEELKVDRQKAM